MADASGGGATARPEPPVLPEAGAVVMFMATWCGFCRMLRADLDRSGVDYTMVDVDRDDTAAAFVMSVNGGDRVVPTVLFADGTTVTNPPGSAVVARLAAAGSA
jgi:mycoredoxin